MHRSSSAKAHRNISIESNHGKNHRLHWHALRDHVHFPIFQLSKLANPLNICSVRFLSRFAHPNNEPNRRNQFIFRAKLSVECMVFVWVGNSQMNTNYLIVIFHTVLLKLFVDKLIFLNKKQREYFGLLFDSPHFCRSVSLSVFRSCLIEMNLINGSV